MSNDCQSISIADLFFLCSPAFLWATFSALQEQELLNNTWAQNQVMGSCQDIGTLNCASNKFWYYFSTTTLPELMFHMSMEYILLTIVSVWKVEAPSKKLKSLA